MPIVKHYVVSQTREVHVRANSLEDAIRIASASFRGDMIKPEEVWGDTTSAIEATDISARESF